MENPIPEKYRSDHLFLTVGTNPLPNYVVARLLSKKSSTIYLLHSDGADGATSTMQLAYFLQNALVKEGFAKEKIILSGISEADGGEIERKMIELLNREKVSGSVGLDYTGGTKAMSVHTYHALWKKFPDSTFSYLDARKLGMRIKGVSKPYPVAGAVNLTLEELSALHGYTLPTPRKTPQHQVLFRALAEIHATKDGYAQWKEWLKKSPLTTLPREAGSVIDVTVYPALQEVLNAMDVLCGGKATPDLLAQKLGFQELKSASKWLNGSWLEELALEAVAKNALSSNIQSYGIELKPTPGKGILRDKKKGTNFELDVAAMIGYQLFAISCIVSDDSGGETKKHLFEAYVRARQLGGDEARVALLCCVQNVQKLQAEIEREWHVSQQIRVFGRDDLMDLEKKLKDWFAHASS